MSVTSTPKGSDLELDALREQIARVIQPACPEVIDGLLAKSKPEMHGRLLATWFGPDVFAKADAILSLISARKGQGPHPPSASGLGQAKVDASRAAQ